MSRFLAPVTVLGPGARLALWVQGCDIGCPGCASADTWGRDGGRSVGVAELSATIAAEIETRGLDGITVTGGEPTDQGAALAEVLMGVRAQLRDQTIDVLVFTGRTLSAARRRAPGLIAAADCVVSGPYQRERPGSGRLLASGNQTITFASDTVRARYQPWLEDDRPRLQVAADRDDLYIIGLPAPGELDTFAARLHERGVALSEVTWQL